LFENIISGIGEFFDDVWPDEFCWPCFLEGAAQGFAIGFLALAAIASAPAWLAVGLTVGLLALGAYGMAQLAANWDRMSDGEKSHAIGGIAGGLAAGGFGPRVPPNPLAIPGVQLLALSDGAVVPVLVTVTTVNAAAGGGAAAGVGAAGAVAMMSGGGGGGGDEDGAPKKASTYKKIKPGSKEWNDAVKDMKQPGKGKNYRVESEAEAKQLLKEAKGEIPQQETYTKQPYKTGYEVHPNESGSANAPHNDLPHIKWKDWSGGKRTGGNGHIFFDE
jgi:hypothetical protein